MDAEIDWPSAGYSWTEHGHELTVPLDAVEAGVAAALTRHAERIESETRLAEPWLAALRAG